jgi:hypothetical protein
MASTNEITVRSMYEAANADEIFHVTTMRGGLIVRIEGFSDRDSARRALEAT